MFSDQVISSNVRRILRELSLTSKESLLILIVLCYDTEQYFLSVKLLYRLIMYNDIVVASKFPKRHFRIMTWTIAYVSPLLNHQTRELNKNIVIIVNQQLWIKRLVYGSLFHESLRFLTDLTSVNNVKYSVLFLIDHQFEIDVVNLWRYWLYTNLSIKNIMLICSTSSENYLYLKIIESYKVPNVLWYFWSD